MSYRECLWIKHPVDVEKYVLILETEYGARPHPGQPGSYLIGDPPLPFFMPQLIDECVAVTSFNRVPLSPILLEALLVHPELMPANTLVRWTEEQEMVLEGTLAALRLQFPGKER